MWIIGFIKNSPHSKLWMKKDKKKVCEMEILWTHIVWSFIFILASNYHNISRVDDWHISMYQDMQKCSTKKNTKPLP